MTNISFAERIERLEQAFQELHPKHVMAPEVREVDDLLDEIIEAMYAGSAELFKKLDSSGMAMTTLFFAQVRKKYPDNGASLLGHFADRANREREADRRAKRKEKADDACCRACCSR